MCRRLVTAAFVVLALASTPGAAQQAPVGPAYRIHPGDEIEILVWGEARLQRTVRVLPTVRLHFHWQGKSLQAGSFRWTLSASSRPLSGRSTEELCHRSLSW